MYNGWFCFGGNEIINNSRTMAYAQSAECAVSWFADDPCRSIIQMTEGAAKGYELPWYDYANITDAPWFDTGDNGWPSREFLGVYCISAEGLVDSTREAPMVQRTGDGGVLGRERYASRVTRFRCVLTALSEAGLEYGQSWLSAALAEQGCQTHGGNSCGSTDMTFFTHCFPDQNMWNPDSDFGPAMMDLEVDRHTRRIHGVKVTSGPLVQRELQSPTSRARGRIIEFTIQAEAPFVYGIPFPVLDPSAGNTRVLDDPLNLVPVPSAQHVTGSDTIIMYNHSLNPSVETNDTLWSSVSSGGVSAAGGITGGRSLDIAAVGVASYRARWVPPAAGAVAGTLGIQQDVVFVTPIMAGDRMSINMWAATTIEAGAPVLGPLKVTAFWRTGAVTTRTDEIGVIDSAGGGSGSTSKIGIVPPVGCTSVIVRVTIDVTSWNAGTILRLYADALAVTTP